MRIITILFCFLSLTVSSDNALATNLVSNGDFEAGDFTGWMQSGGVIAGEELDFLGPGGSGSFPGSGVFVASFSAGSFGTDGVLSQSITTVSRQEYLLAFDYGAFGPSPEQQSLGVTVSDSSAATVASLTAVDTTATGDLSVVFDPYTLAFVATSANSTITFSDLSSTGLSIDGLLDNVAVTPIPEPMSILLLGCGSLGAFIRRR